MAFLQLHAEKSKEETLDLVRKHRGTTIYVTVHELTQEFFTKLEQAAKKNMLVISSNGCTSAACASEHYVHLSDPRNTNDLIIAITECASAVPGKKLFVFDSLEGFSRYLDNGTLDRFLTFIITTLATADAEAIILTRGDNELLRKIDLLKRYAPSPGQGE